MRMSKRNRKLIQRQREADRKGRFVMWFIMRKR